MKAYDTESYEKRNEHLRELQGEMVKVRLRRSVPALVRAGKHLAAASKGAARGIQALAQNVKALSGCFQQMRNQP